ncbi:MAG: class I SAM-dependent methyltransferase [Thermoplasmata archaeon]|nr:class I SAM-dependent methyltransferase [Thermoplasmata archaeon]
MGKKRKEGMFKKILPKLGLFFDIERMKKIVDFSYIVIEKFSMIFPMIAKDYVTFYEELVEREIKLAGVTRDDKILNIGSGPVPATSLLLSKKVGTDITCIDIDKNAVRHAKNFLKKQGMDQIKVEYGDGTKYDVSEFDVIFISWGVNNLFQILRNVSNKMKNDARVVIRLPKSERFQKDLEKKLGKTLKIEKTIPQPSYSNSKSILLLKVKT